MSLPLLFKSDPVFDIKADIKQIRDTPASDSEIAPHLGKLPINSNVARMPTFRAYVLTNQLQPVAIFDQLSYEDMGAFIKIALCMSPKHINNPEGYRDIEAMNQGRKFFCSATFKKPFKVALFMADKILFHSSIPVDLMIYLCTRFRELDIVNRGIWEIITGDPDGQNP